MLRTLHFFRYIELFDISNVCLIKQCQSCFSFNIYIVLSLYVLRLYEKLQYLQYKQVKSLNYGNCNWTIRKLKIETTKV